MSKEDRNERFVEGYKGCSRETNGIITLLHGKNACAFVETIVSPSSGRGPRKAKGSSAREKRINNEISRF